MRRVKNFRESLLESLKDPMEASAYIDAAIRENDSQFLKVALMDVAEAYGQSAKLTRLLKSKKVLDMATIESFLKQMRLYLTVIPDEKHSIRRAA